MELFQPLRENLSDRANGGKWNKSRVKFGLNCSV